jgi:hypothetical protein
MRGRESIVCAWAVGADRGIAQWKIAGARADSDGVPSEAWVHAHGQDARATSKTLVSRRVRITAVREKPPRGGHGGRCAAARSDRDRSGIIPNAFWIVPNAFWTVPEVFWTVPNAFWEVPNPFWTVPNALGTVPALFWTVPKALKTVPKAFCTVPEAF